LAGLPALDLAPSPDGDTSDTTVSRIARACTVPRKGDASDQDWAIADALSAQIAADRRRRRRREAEVVKAAQLREQRLEREAASEVSAIGTARGT
jgi:hypothetical protein